jgi:energy-coupling factor transporter ATP-binding protein EcfA2
MTEKFYFEHRSGEKLIILGEKPFGKTLMLDIMKGISKFRHLRMHDDFWFLDREEKKRAIINNNVITSKRIDDFNILREDLYLVIDLSKYVDLKHSFQDRRNILTELALKIDYKATTSNEKKQCTCDVYHLLRSHGCKCGAIIPYKGKSIYE